MGTVEIAAFKAFSSQEAFYGPIRAFLRNKFCLSALFYVI